MITFSHVELIKVALGHNPQKTKSSREIGNDGVRDCQLLHTIPLVTYRFFPFFFCIGKDEAFCFRFSYLFSFCTLLNRGHRHDASFDGLRDVRQAESRRT